MKSKRVFVVVSFLVFTGCSSDSGGLKEGPPGTAIDSGGLIEGPPGTVIYPTETTIDPQIAELQQQVEELQTQISATTTTNATKAAPVFSHQGRYNTGNYKSTFSGGVETKLIQCQVTDFYTDGSFFEYPRTWMKYDDYKATGC
jgi:hypothetical protein